MYEKGQTDIYTNTEPTVNNATTVEVDAFGTPAFRRFRFIYFILLSVLAFCGSLYLFFTLWRKGFFKIHFYLFVGHLCGIYFIFGSFILPFYIVMFTLEGYWPFGAGLCNVFNIVHNICVYEMQVTVVLVATDRLWAMKWPHHYRTHRSFRNMMLTLGLSWAYCCFTGIVVYAVFPTVIHDRITQSYNVTVCSIAITPSFQYWKATITMGFLIPSVVGLIIYGTIFYIAVVRLYRKRSKISVVPVNAPVSAPSANVQNGAPVTTVPAANDHDLDIPPGIPRSRIFSVRNSSNPGETGGKTAGGTATQINTQREERVLFIMLVVVINFLVCLLPYATYCVLWFYKIMTPNRYFFTVGHLLLFSHPVLDTFAFTFTNKELRPSFTGWTRSSSKAGPEERKP